MRPPLVASGAARSAGRRNGSGLGVALAVGDSLAVGVLEPVGVLDGVGLALAVAVSLAVGGELGVALNDRVAIALRVAVDPALGLVVGVGVLVDDEPPPAQPARQSTKNSSDARDIIGRLCGAPSAIESTSVGGASQPSAGGAATRAQRRASRSRISVSSTS